MKTLSVIILSLLALIILAGCGTTVPGGYHGIYWQRFQGVDTTIYADGFKWHWPWSDVVLYDTRWKTESENVDILSLDDLHMEIEIALRLKPKEHELYELHQQVGSNYYREIVQQQFRAVTRTVLAKYKYNDITKKSVDIQNTILAQLREAINGKHLDLNAVEIKHVEYPPLVKQAADTKLATEQRLMQKEFEEKIAEKDAEIKIIEAKGQQTAQRIIDSTLTPTYLQYRALDIQKALVNSSNASFFFVPIGSNGMPIILNAGMGTKK
jgi:regulator of protease activity HflC (stomatin/prohibitin superfamily)